MKTNDIYFIRWGNLNPVKHKEAREPEGEDRWYHTAHVVKCIYAFPRGYVETFLLGGPTGDKRNIFLKDEDSNKIKDDFNFWCKQFKNGTYDIFPKYKKLLKKNHIKIRDLSSIYIEEDECCYITYRNIRPKTFTYTGDIWYHLGAYVDKSNIITSKGSWVKTSFNVYYKALKKCDTLNRFENYMKYNKDRHGDPHTSPASGFRDQYEVFIEKIK